MSWKESIAEAWRDALRLLAGSLLLVNAILLSVFSVWFVANFLWQLRAWLNHTLFGKQW